MPSLLWLPAAISNDIADRTAGRRGAGRRGRAHRQAGTSFDDNMADPDCIAEAHLRLYRQHRSTWAFGVVLRPWFENGDGARVTVRARQGTSQRSEAGHP